MQTDIRQDTELGGCTDVLAFRMKHRPAPRLNHCCYSLSVLAVAVINWLITVGRLIWRSMMVAKALQNA